MDFTRDRTEGERTVESEGNFRSVLPSLWSLKRNHQHHLGTCEKCITLGSTPHLLIHPTPPESKPLGAGVQKYVFLTGLPGDFYYISF